MSSATLTETDTTLPRGTTAADVGPEELWERHGGALFAMARVLLADDSAALNAATLGLVDLPPVMGCGLRELAYGMTRHAGSRPAGSSVVTPVRDHP